MIKLHGKVTSLNTAMFEPTLLTLTRNKNLPERLREKHIYLADSEQAPDGFGAAFAKSDQAFSPTSTTPAYRLSADLDYLTEGDVVRLNPAANTLHTLFRRNSSHNTILLTERCNHYCLMCSQPPKDIHDDWLMDDAFKLIELMPEDTATIGFSGGEPTLYGQRLIDLINHTKSFLPRTHVDILSNGRAFKDYSYARDFGAIKHPSCIIGIPVYSDDPVRHDYVVQSDGAFDETIRGILNLKRAGHKVEIRVVIHKQTIDRLVQTCEFIARNLLFVDHVALMGLEITGFTRANLDKLWIDPHEYRDVLSDALAVLNAYRIKTSVYNHQLCVINRDVERNYAKSISDWKNEYVDACNGCSRMHECGGFFSSSKTYRHTDYVVPFA